VKRDFAVLLDACVLIPMPLADTLLRLAAGPRLYQAKWSDQIMSEVSRSLQEKFGLSAQKAMYRESEIRRHFPEAWITDYEDSIPAMTNHPKDRHVLAAAARAGVKVIVTYNIKDFPRSSLAPYSITAQGPSTFSQESLRNRLLGSDTDVGSSSRSHRPTDDLPAFQAPDQCTGLRRND
jgi:hypothetical protein